MQNYLTQLEEQYLLETKEFYLPYFSEKESLDLFINRIFQFDWDDRKPRQMLFKYNVLLPFNERVYHSTIPRTL